MHRHLKGWRKEHSRPAAPRGDGGPAASQGSWGTPQIDFDLDMEDLADSPRFDWRAYVEDRGQDELDTVFGEGDQSFKRFEIRFITPIDRNCNQHRCDFIAHRTDGVLVRFHPSQNCEEDRVAHDSKVDDMKGKEQQQLELIARERAARSGLAPHPGAHSSHAWGAFWALGVSAPLAGERASNPDRCDYASSPQASPTKKK